MNDMLSIAGRVNSFPIAICIQVSIEILLTWIYGEMHRNALSSIEDIKDTIRTSKVKILFRLMSLVSVTPPTGLSVDRGFHWVFLITRREVSWSTCETAEYRPVTLGISIDSINELRRKLKSTRRHKTEN